jgi:hypothetical protein
VAGQPLFSLHAQSAGELAYGLAYVRSQPAIVSLDALDARDAPAP